MGITMRPIRKGGFMKAYRQIGVLVVVVMGAWCVRPVLSAPHAPPEPEAQARVSRDKPSLPPSLRYGETSALRAPHEPYTGPRTVLAAVVEAENAPWAPKRATLLTASAPAGGVKPASGKPRVEVELFASQKAMAPGQPLELAVKFKIESGWHIYWRSRGEGGMKTTFRWKLPPGFTVGPMRYPPPRRHVDKGDIHTFILEGQPVILTTLNVPADIKPGERVTIGLDVGWLVCSDEACVPGDKSLTLPVAVAAKASDARPANEPLFKGARSELPLPAEKAKFLQRLYAAADVDKVRPGDKFNVAVVLQIEPGYHINSHQPLSEFLVPTDLFHDSTEGLSIVRPRFPAGRIEPSPLPGEKLSVYRGRTVIVLPVEADAELPGKEVRVTGIVTYQACTDKGQCFPRTSAEWSLALPVAAKGATVAATNKELFSPETGKGSFLDGDFRPTTQREEHSLLGWLALALLAGLILNVTPCVLPVISIKVLSFVQQASESPARVFKLGLAFSVGMLLVFNVLATLATAAGLAWGQHFQSPVFTVAMAAIVFAFGLSMFGVFTLGVPKAVGHFAAQADQAPDEGYLGSVAKGALATVMGTPCLGPFLGPVLVWATAQTPPTVFLTFNTIGVGMALPYVLLTANPRWLRFVPRPGPWLTTFKQAMAFLLMATVVYLLYIVEGQLGGPALVWTLAFLTGLSLACWIVGTWATYQTSPGGRLAAWVMAAAVVGLSGWLSFGREGGLSGGAERRVGVEPGKPEGVELPWVPFSLDKLTELTAAGKPVFLDITASWCVNCQVNTAFVFETREMAEAVKKYGVIPMLADWSVENSEIEQLIRKLAPGASIPLAAVFPAGRPNEPIVMLGLVTKAQVIDALRQGAGTATVAAESKPAEGE